MFISMALQQDLFSFVNLSCKPHEINFQLKGAKELPHPPYCFIHQHYFLTIKQIVARMM